jgi:hypothetical protein
MEEPNYIKDMKYQTEKFNLPLYSLTGELLLSKEGFVLRPKNLKLEECKTQPTDGTQLFYNKEYNIFIRIPKHYYYFQYYGEKIYAYKNLKFEPMNEPEKVQIDE